MRTRRFFKYLMAMIIALGTSVNAMAQQKTMKIYFEQNLSGAENSATPPFTLRGDIPLTGVMISPTGVVWANGYRWFSGWHGTATDRLLAAYVDKNTKMDSHMKLTFTNFPFEVNAIQWNAMKDLFSGSIFDLTDFTTNILDNHYVNCIYTPENGETVNGQKRGWDLNFLNNQATFVQGNMPGASNMTLNGLKSFEINEENYKKSPLGILYNKKSPLDDRCRTFIKAGWDGTTEPGDNDWAFSVKYSLPDIRMRSYNCSVANVGGNEKVTRGEIDNNIIVGEHDVHALRGYISAHAGAVVPKDNPTDPDDFHYEYEADQNKIIIRPQTGLIKQVKVAGDIPVTVKLMCGTRLVCSYTQTIHVYSDDPTISEIAIGFLNGNKGYDVTVGDENAQIQGFITKYGENITLSNGTSGYHFEYSEDSNGEIITIDPLTGKITAKKEGDVVVSAVLKNGGTIKSNTYTYSLHVFAQHEGLELQRPTTWKYSEDNNNYNYGGWVVTATNSQTYEWKSESLLKVGTSINNTNNWKQIASLNTTAIDHWRAICQGIQFDVKVPKYSKSTATYAFAGNMAIGEKKTHRYWNVYHYETSDGNCKYGFEVKDLGSNIDACTGVTWNTNNQTEASSPTDYTTFVRKYTEAYQSNVGDGGEFTRNIDNSTGGTHITDSRYLAIMAYLWNNEQYPGDASFGFKGIPTYEYYSTVTYYTNDGTGNDGTGNVWETQKFTSTSKTATMPMYSGAHNLPTRAGYELLGWSTDPNATTAEYQKEGDTFCPYDAVNGGGKGPVPLYAVWRPNTYTVELRHTSTGPVDGYVYATFDQPMPLVDVEGNPVVAPTNKGYDFGGYYGEAVGQGEKYYNADMSSNHVWDRANADKNYVIARWIPHKTTVVFDPQGGNNYGATRVTATFSSDMPTEGVQAPQRQGYTFGGYYSEVNGQGTQYYTAAMASARTWNIDERLLDPQVTEVTLYAKWIGNTYAVTFDKQGGTGGSSSTTATYGQPLPSGLTAPTKPGYEFRGYYSNKNDEWAESQGNDNYYGGKQYYDKDMNGVEPWDQTQAATIYAHWAPATYIVTLDAAGGVLPNPVVDDNATNFDITKVSSSVMTISYKYGTGKTHDLVHATAKKPGYELLGWYVGDVKVISVDEKSRNCTITDNGGYWKENGVKYNYAGDLTLTAKYRKKYQYKDNVISFDNEKVEDGEDWLWAVVNDLVGSAKDVYDHEEGHPQTMVFDLRNSTNMWTGHEYNCQKVMEDLQKSEYSEYISPNVLVYFNTKSYGASDCNNAILSDYTCPNLYVADRYQMKIPYAFNAGKATYERNKLQIDTDDPMWQQSYESIWGTLCLPYPIKNNNAYKDVSKVIFYELRKKSGSVMQFYKLPEDAVIPANTPVLYERTVGIGSAVTIEEISQNIYEPSIFVPDNPNFDAVVKSYADAPEPSIHDWEFRGNLKTNVFCGKGYINPPAEGILNSDITDNGDVYYFKQNKFTHLNPLKEKNGKVYQAGMMTLYPYRAYFYQKGSSGSAKVAAYSILVVDEFGNTTDITNAVFGDGEGDGKIYDLNGIRVMQPVKGRLYIVNGQKKVYR